jgi:prophage regulatory protein
LSDAKQPLKPLLVTREAAAELVGISVTTLDTEVRQGRFPRPRQLSPRRVGWLVRELEEWAEARPHSELLPPPNTGAKKPRRAFAPDLPEVPDDHMSTATAADVAGWMLAQIEAHGELLQSRAVRGIRAEFGDGFFTVNPRGWHAIREDVLKAFRQMSGADVVWDNPLKLWRRRVPGDSTRRVQN